MSHASMLKARRQHQKNRKLLDVAAKQAKRLAKLATTGPVVKKEKVKKEKVKKEKVKTEKVQEGQADQGGAWPAGREEGRNAAPGRKARPGLPRAGRGRLVASNRAAPAV